MGSIPRIGPRPDRLIQIEGSMPRLTDIPSGCAFNPRCPKVFANCHHTRPELRQIADGAAACLLYEGVTQ
jgi:oligopeptide/dipeptide ABC transporter ATP-binding protein